MKNIKILFFYLILTVAMTYPLFFRINCYMPGFFSTDESFAILWNAWRIKFCLLNHLSIKTTDFIAYPSLVNFYSNQPVSYLWFFINYILSILTTPVLTYNLQIFLNYILSAFFSYLLAFLLTKNRAAALFSGIAFGFCPYIFVRSWQHLGETYLWPMPLFLWSLLRLKDNNHLAVKIIFVFSLICAAINYNVMYYTLVITATFFAFSFLKRQRDFGKYFLTVISLFFIASVFLLPQFWPVIKKLIFPSTDASSAWNVYHRSFSDLFEQSARPLSYFLPSVAHPLFGKFTERFVGSALYGMSFTEHTLYLGWVVLILAFFAFKKWRVNYKVTTDDSNYYLVFFVLLAIVAWLFSQPPWWNLFGFKIYMPSFFVYKILPMFRAYCRFGIVVMLAVSILAGFGLKFLLESFKSIKTKIAVTVLFLCLLLFDFWNYPPFKVIDVSKFPAVYYWLKQQPGQLVIAEYPLDIDGPNEMYKLYQTFHEKKLINGTIPGTPQNQVAQSLIRLADSSTISKLKEIGVKYILVHRDAYLETGLVKDAEELELIARNPDLKLIKNFPSQSYQKQGIICIQKTGPIDVYELDKSQINIQKKR